MLNSQLFKEIKKRPNQTTQEMVKESLTRSASETAGNDSWMMVMRLEQLLILSQKLLLQNYPSPPIHMLQIQLERLSDMGKQRKRAQDLTVWKGGSMTNMVTDEITYFQVKLRIQLLL
jgi:uncharacterized SAM-dependent methyltransferase